MWEFFDSLALVVHPRTTVGRIFNGLYDRYSYGSLRPNASPFTSLHCEAAGDAEWAPGRRPSAARIQFRSVSVSPEDHRRPT